MRRLIMIFWLGLVLLIFAMGFIRLAPSDPARWHVPPQVSENKDFSAGVKRLISPGPDGLARFDEIALSTPRTSVLAGSVESGMVTYITRSAVFGFPDFTTVQQDGDTLQIYARLRFGRSDTGVNRARIGKWIDALGL
jgi:uncharacterized protein (DUF1499 family)